MALNYSNMEYYLSYCFKGKSYSIKENVPQKVSTNQLETIAEGLALSSAEHSKHPLYGKYTNMCLFENGKIVWTAEIRIISEIYSFSSMK